MLDRKNARDIYPATGPVRTAKSWQTEAAMRMLMNNLHPDVAENKHIAMPCVTDSTPTSANQEDHVSMAAHGAVRLGRMVENLNMIVGVEAICAAQGIDFRAPLRTSAPLQRVVSRLREQVATLGDDRYLAPDLQAAAALIANGALADASGLPLPLLSPNGAHHA